MMRVGGSGGPERYEGFCVDMLQELAGLLKFRFHIKLVEDGLYGAPEPNGSWTGMVGELINRVRAGGAWGGVGGTFWRGLDYPGAGSGGFWCVRVQPTGSWRCPGVGYGRFWSVQGQMMGEVGV